MKRIFVFLIFAVTFALSEGRTAGFLEELENSALQIRQKPGTDKLLADWLAEAGVTEDTVYAYIYMPASCPRCESSIKIYKEELGRAGKKFLLLAVMEDREAAEFYNKEKGYAADYYIYDTTNRYKDIFSFNNIDLDGSDMLKITKSGRLITGFEGSYFRFDLFRELLAKTEPLDYKDFGSTTNAEAATDWLYPISKANVKKMGAMKDFRLDVSPDAPLCEVFRNPYFRDGLFFYPDELLGGVPVFKRKDGTDVFAFERVLSPTDDEKDQFVSISPEALKMMKDGGGVHYIVCNAWMLDSTHIGMSYSLPEIYADSLGNNCYFNQPYILSRNVEDYAENPCMPFNYNVFTEDYMYQHFQFSSTGDKIIIGCWKMTWPIEFEPEEYKGKVDKDPFMAGFYDNETPFMAAFDRRTGKLLQRFGHLDDLARKAFTGYYFMSSLSTVGGSELAYTDSYSGKVYVADTADLSREKACYTVFGIDEKTLPPVDTTKFYSYEIAKSLRKVYCRQVADIRITPEKLYCMVTYGDTSDPSEERKDYTFVTIDRKTGERSECLYPKTEEGYNVFCRGLYEQGHDVYPFAVLKGKNGGALLRVYMPK